MKTLSKPGRERTATEIGLVGSSVAVLVWGLGPLFAKGSGLSALTIAGLRFAMSAPILHTVARVSGARIRRGVYRRSLFPGLLFAATSLTSFAAINTTSVTNATLIGNMMPVVVLLYVRFALRQELDLRHYLLVAAAVGGVTIVVVGAGSGGDSALAGDLLAIANALVWSAYFMRTKRLRDAHENSWAMLAAINTICAVAMVPLCLVLTDLRDIDLKGTANVFALVLGPGVIGHGLMTWSSKHLDVTISSVLTLGTPVVSATGAWIFLGEAINPWQAIGAGIVLGALGAIALNIRFEAVRDAALSERPE